MLEVIQRERDTSLDEVLYWVYFEAMGDPPKHMYKKGGRLSSMIDSDFEASRHESTNLEPKVEKSNLPGMNSLCGPKYYIIL